MRWAGQISHTGQKNEYRISAGKREGRRKGESNFKMDLKGMECERMDYILW